MTKTLGPYGAVAKKPPISGSFPKAINIFPVPGLSTLMSKGFDPHQKGIAIKATSRHANVMLVAPPLSEELKQYAAVAFVQMPRPRMLVFVDIEKADPLPKADLALSSSDISQLRDLILEFHIVSKDISAFEPGFIIDALDSDKKEKSQEHHHHHSEHKHQEHQEHGQQHSGHAHHQQEEHDHDKMDHNHGEHDMSSHGGSQHEGHQHMQHSEHQGHEGGHKGLSGGHEGHGHGGGMGFMSMVAMTKNMPRSMDGLAMEMNEVRFGPFHPGLQDGLRIKMMLDGDTVMKAEYEKGLLCRHLLHHFPKYPKDLPAYLSKMDPLQSETFKALAILALDNAAGTPRSDVSRIVLEKERIIYHLHVLLVMMKSAGDQKSVYKICGLLNLLNHNFPANQLLSFTDKLEKKKYLRHRLRQTASIPENLLHHLTGPVAKAAGQRIDGRMNDPWYENFKPVVLNEDNAWGRLLIRLEEIRQSVDIISKNAVKVSDSTSDQNFEETTKGTASIEAPTGKATLALEISENEIKKLSLESSSIHLSALIPHLTMGHELSDTLLTIASLGISPWEIDL